jgi:hypothetical protein
VNEMEQFLSNVNLNVRAEPSLASKPVAWYGKGDPVTVTEIQGEWAKTTKGWVKISRLSKVQTQEVSQNQPEQSVEIDKVPSEEIKKKEVVVLEEQTKESTTQMVAETSASQNAPVAPPEISVAQNVSAVETAVPVSTIETASATTTTVVSTPVATTSSGFGGWGWAAGALLLGGGVAAAAGGGGGGGSSTPAPSANTGTLIDSAISGVSYTTSSGLSGTTDANGKFNYRPGDTITFKISNVTIGTNLTIPPDGIIFPQDIIGVSREDVTDLSVVKLAQFFQTLDADGDLSNGIQITNVTIPDLVDAPNTIVNWATVDVSTLFVDPGSIVGESEAIVHLNETMKNELPSGFSDDTAPTASVTTATLANTANAVVQSNEAGRAYIVKDTVVINTLADITNAADNEYNSVAITTADTNTNLALTGLVDGTYKVYTVDAAGNLSGASSNTVTVDTTAPTATVELSDTALKVGETAILTVTFSEVPTGFVEADDLVVANGTLSDGEFDITGKIYTATFTPTEDVEDATNVVTLGTGWTDAAGNAPEADTDSANYEIDTTAPTATVELSDTALKVGETAILTVTFSEVPTGFVEADDLVVANGTLSDGEFDITGKIYTATFTPTEDVEDATNVVTLGTGWTDAAGNAPEADTDSANYEIDTTAPTATVELSDTALKVGETAILTVTFSEVPTGFVEADDLVVANGTLSDGEFDITGKIYTATFTPTEDVEDATNVVTLGTGWTDAAGNAPEADTDSANYEIDTTAPTATVELSDTALKVGETAILTVTFSEVPTGFVEADDLVVANGTLSDGEFDITGKIYTATFTPTEDVEDATNVVTLGTGWTDAAGNAPEADTDSANYEIDTTAPTATVELSDTALKVGETAILTVTFSEVPTGFVEADDLVVANGTLSDGEFDITGKIYTATFTPTEDVEDATNVVTLGTGWTDAAGNAPTEETDSANYEIDTTAPTATVELSDTALKVGETAILTVTFSEVPTGFVEADDLVVANGTLSDGEFDITGKIYTATFTPTEDVEDATNVVTLGTGWTDAAGNAPEADTDSANYEIDTTAPTATVELSDTALKVGETAILTVTFSEVPTGFVEADDLVVANGTLSDGEFDITGKIYTATFTPTEDVEDATNVVTLGTGWTDAAGNAPEADTDSANYEIDTTAPTATVELSDTALKVGETAILTVTFSEVPTGFVEADDLVVANGTLSDGEFDITGKIYTATFTPTEDVEDATNVVTLGTGWTDAAGNAPEADTDSANYEIDTTAPTATVELSDTALKVGETAILTVTFSEVPTGFVEADDLVVANGTLSDGEFDITGKIYTATFTPTEDVEDATNVVTLGTGWTDAAGNAPEADTDSDNYEIDTTAPSIVTTTPDDYGVTYGPASFYAELSTDGTTIVLSADEPMSIGTAVAGNFTLDGTVVTITDVAIDGDDSTKIILTLSASLTRDVNPITLTYNGGLTDLAGNALATFTSEAVRNSVSQASPISASINAATFVQQDGEGDQYYITLGGSGFNQFKDAANGALNGTDLKDQFDWSKFVWEIKGDSDTNVTFTVDDIEKVNIVTNSTMKIFLTPVKWNAISAIDGLLTSSSTPTADILNISSGFLQDADGIASIATYATVFGDSQYYVELENDTVLPDIYAAGVFVSGTGTLNGSTIYSTEVSVQVSGDGDIILENMTQLGTLDSLKTSGTLTVQGWGSDGATIANAGIINSGGDEIQVWIDTPNIGNNVLSNFMFLGDNFSIIFDKAAADITLMSDDNNGVHSLQYLGDIADGDGGLTVNGFLSGVDEVILDSSIFLSLSGTGSPVDLDAANFVSRAGDNEAQDADDFVIYNASTGGIYYDADGNGAGAAVLLMTLADMPSIVYDDFKVI